MSLHLIVLSQVNWELLLPEPVMLENHLEIQPLYSARINMSVSKKGFRTGIRISNHINLLEETAEIIDPDGDSEFAKQKLLCVF